jgi:peptidoglycan/xylan/chitin deacetylase (PgdA/CDA1 family)
MKARSQTALLVLLITAVVVVWSGASGIDLLGDADAEPEDHLAAQDAATTTPRSVVDLSPTAPATPPPTLALTPEPSSEPTPAPSPTAEPATAMVTERPAPPRTGVDDASYIVERGESGRQEVALTFDAGEGPGYTEEILDLLAERGIRASFGVTGQWAEQNPELIRRIVVEGHMLINHTYDHRSWTGASPGTEPLTASERRDELEQTEQIVLDIVGYEMKPYFRFPYGDYDPEALVLLKEAGYDYTLWWTCDTMAWMSSTPQEIVDRCDPGDPTTGGPGAVILMHVAQEGDLGALPGIIDAYDAAGYDFVTMEQLVQP